MAQNLMEEDFPPADHPVGVQFDPETELTSWWRSKDVTAAWSCGDPDQISELPCDHRIGMKRKNEDGRLATTCSNPK
jgi:hypothetical protein